MLAAALGPLRAQPPSAAELQEALREIRALKARLGELETIVSKAGQPTPATPDPAPTSPAPEPAAESTTGFVKWNEVITSNTRFKLYGFLRADAIYDDSRPNNTHVPAFIRSEDPTAPGTISSARNAEDFTMHPKLTRFGIDFTGPEVAALGHAKTSGKLEIDFYNANAAESREVPRMRHAYLKLGWDHGSFLAGQTADVISPIFPIVNPDFVMWGAGNLGDRRPQFRGEFAPRIGSSQFFWQGMVGLTGADDNQDLDANGFRDGEASGKPTLQGRLAWRRPLWAKQNFELGVWGHRAWEETDAPVAGRTQFDSYAYGLDLTVPLYKDLLSLKGEVWSGKNLTDVRGGILQGINAATGEEVHSQGGFVELGLHPARWYSLHTGYSFEDPRNRDLPATGRASNSIWYFAGRLYFDPIEIGLDYLNWTTRYVAFGPGHDHRFQSYVSYKF